jgi:thiol:disulfide interchange protein
MQFEILNTVKFLVYVVIMAVIYWKMKRYKVVKTSWNVFLLLTFMATLLSYKQFFTLTEHEDIKASQRMMSKQSHQISNGRTVSLYLKNNKPVVVDSKAEREAELEYQNLKSKTLAESIDAAHKDK